MTRFHASVLNEIHTAAARKPRRLRAYPALRELVQETRLHPSDLILPMFIADGIREPHPISSMPGVYQHTSDSLLRETHRALEAGVRCVDLFGVPRAQDKDARGSTGIAEDGVLNRAIALLRREFGNDLMIMADTCLDEFTDHGHCGVLTTDRWGDTHVDNATSLPLYQQMAVAQAAAGAHIDSPSGMMDGQVAAIRDALDNAGFPQVAIMAYSAKYASAFFGPFREAVGSSLEGDRLTYQQNPGNAKEAMIEAALDVAEGADFVLVKPAGYYLDILSDIAQSCPVSVAAYQVSGEYSMIQAAAAQGYLDREATILESLLSIKRAGAEQILTYFATDAALALR